MERENILVILHEMAMVIGGETRLQPLLTRTLQRLLYHTSFPAGFVSLDLPPPAPGEETVEVRLDAVVGDYELTQLAGQTARLPAALVRGVAERAENAALLATLPGVSGRYRAFLRLPINGVGVIVLLAPTMPETELPLTSIFQPIMANLARAIVLCRHHEAYDAGIVAERDAALRGLERFRAALDDSPDCVLLIDPKTLRLVDFNRMTERLLGYTREELLALGPQDLARGKTRADFVRLFADLASGSPEGVTLEAACRHKDGAEHPVEARFTWLAPPGAAPLVIAVARDITERRRTEAALREAEERYRGIFAGARDGIVLIDADTGLVADCNPEFERQCGRPLAQLKALHIWELRPPAAQKVARAKFEEVKAAGGGGSAELAFQRPDGAIVPIEFVSTRLRIGGRDFLQSISRDITERQRGEQELARSKELLERMFESIHVLVAYTDRDFNFIRVNRAYAEADGRTPEFFPGKNHFVLYPGKEVETIFRRVVETGEPYVAIERPFEYAGHPERGVSYWDWRVEPVRGVGGQVEGLIFSLLNVTERVQARQALAESEEKFRRISASAQDAVIMLDDAGNIAYWNPAAERIFGYSAEEVVGKGMHALFAPARYRETYEKGFAAFRVSGEGPVIGKTLELEALRKDGSEFPIELSVSAVRLKGRWHAVGILRDITARKHAEEEVRHLSRQNRLILDSAGEGIYGVDLDGRCTFVNPAAAKMLGYAPEELVGRPAHEIFHHSHADGSPYPETECPVQKAHRKGQVYRGTHEVYWRKDGSRFPIEYVSVPIVEDGQILGAVASFLDITERQRAEAALRHSEDSLKEAQRIAHIGSWDLDLKRNVLTWSDEIFRIFEIDPAKFGASYEAFLDAIHPDDREFVNRAYTESVRNRTPYDIVHRLQMKVGRIKYVNERCETFYDQSGTPLRSVGTVQDITARRLAEIALSQVNRALRTLSAGNEVLVRATGEAGLLREMCRVIVETGGYRMAWVGYAECDEKKTVRPVAQFGPAEGYVENLRLTWDEADLRGRGPTGVAIRTRRAAVAHDIATEPTFAPWREEALKRGLGSSISLPLFENSRAFGALNIYAAEPNAFDKDEVALLTELATDLAYGIFSLRTRAERHKGETQLRENLVDTIRAIALTVEKRDPYTAGHQQRVSELCVAIGRELGLAPERIEGLRLGALIHDIGKIYIPAEILNRPGRLTKTEFDLIKSHPEVGYDIVKDVKFPWPVAPMILQHHERLDGSGYPNALKGEAIILEARILAVADVVEAMSSHRPYRPVVGVEKALAEIEAHRGTLFDPAVVDACTRLFREKGFTFAG